MPSRVASNGLRPARMPSPWRGRPHLTKSSRCNAGSGRSASAPAHFMQRGDNAALIERLRAELDAAAGNMAELARCPLCRTSSVDPSRTFQPRDNGTFRSRCDFCEASWELRRCARGHAYPVLYGKRSGDEIDDSPDLEIDGDVIDRQFGSETLSARCWVRSAVAYCPHCGECSEARARKDLRCRRCTE